MRKEEPRGDQPEKPNLSTTLYEIVATKTEITQKSETR